MKIIKPFILFIAILFISTACGTSKVKSKGFLQSYCTSQYSYHNDNFTEDTTAFENLTKGNLLPFEKSIAKVLGIGKQIDRLYYLKTNNLIESDDLAQRNEIFELKFHINQKISLAKIEIDAFVSELDCEGERADLAAVYLDDINSNKINSLTIGSMIIGALTTVATAITSDDNIEATVGIAGGLVSVGLSAFTISPKGKKIDFNHPKNTLSPIWFENDSEDCYPGFIWKIFQIKELNSQENLTLMQSTKNRWNEFVIGDDLDAKNESLYFGHGGEYTAEQLHARSEMMDQVKSSVRYINQLISILESHLSKEFEFSTGL